MPKVRDLEQAFLERILDHPRELQAAQEDWNGLDKKHRRQRRRQTRNIKRAAY